MKLFNFNKEIVAVKDGKLQTSNLPGIYLGKEKNKYNFSNRFSHIAAYFEKETENGSSEYSTLLNFHKQYLKNMFNVYSNSNNKASFIYFNGCLSNEEVKSCLNECYIEDVNELSNKPSYAYISDAKVLEKTLSDLFMERKDGVVRNNIFVIIDNFENVKINQIETFLTISRSRNIFFVLLVTDMKKLIKNIGAENFNIIDGNVSTQFVYFFNGARRVTLNKGLSSNRVYVYND